MRVRLKPHDLSGYGMNGAIMLFTVSVLAYAKVVVVFSHRTGPWWSVLGLLLVSVVAEFLSAQWYRAVLGYVEMSVLGLVLVAVMVCQSAWPIVVGALVIRAVVLVAAGWMVRRRCRGYASGHE